MLKLSFQGSDAQYSMNLKLLVNCVMQRNMPKVVVYAKINNIRQFPTTAQCLVMCTISFVKQKPQNGQVVKRGLIS